MKNNILIAYALDFTSFLLERISAGQASRVILFGSAARGEASDDSDIDLFIDVHASQKQAENLVKKVKDEFLKSKRYADYWLLKGIKNEIKPIVGILDEWKELKNSIISNGIILYGKFEDMPEKAVHKALFSWENTKPESKRVLLSKRLFGYKKGEKGYEGLIQKYDGERIGKGMIVVPLANANLFSELFKSMGISVRIKKIMEYK